MKEIASKGSPLSLVISTSVADARRLLIASGNERLVVGLCAQWCGTCREFALTFAALAAEYHETPFVWVDVEDDASIAGDIEVETFPCLAIFRQGRAVHFGATEPSYSVVSRLFSRVLEETQPIVVADAVALLPEALAKNARSHLISQVAP